MVRVLPILVAIVLSVFCLVDLAMSPARDVRMFPRWAWAILILVPFAGGVAWLTVGRPAMPPSYARKPPPGADAGPRSRSIAAHPSSSGSRGGKAGASGRSNGRPDGRSDGRSDARNHADHSDGAGRADRDPRADADAALEQPATPGRMLAPDDDPEFLRELDARLRRERREHPQSSDTGTPDDYDDGTGGSSI